MFEFLTDKNIGSCHSAKDKASQDKSNISTEVIKDIDELIFPDDEPYYVSER